MEVNIIDIFKDNTLYNTLSQYNQDLTDVGKKYIYGINNEWGAKQNIYGGSGWFDPNLDSIKKLYLARTYPNNDPIVSAKEEYNLILYIPNYFSLFLINLLYLNKDICIEDFGCGPAWLVYYLSKCGYINFSLWDNWSQCKKRVFLDVVKKGKISYQLNNFKTNPTVLNNIGSPFIFITPGLNIEDSKQIRNLSNLELICFDSGARWRNILAPKWLGSKGYRYLCEDIDDLAIAYCRNDKYNEFKRKIESYELH